MKKHTTLFLIGCFTLSLSVFASESEIQSADDAVSKAIQAELKAMSERKTQTKCPISGKDISGKNGYVYKGTYIQTCCDGCAKKVEKHPLNALLKIRQNDEEPILAEGFKAQSKCPATGEKANPDIFTVKNNTLVRFCCAGCEKSFSKEPEKVTDKILEGKEAPVLITLEQKLCPISGHPINGKDFVVHNGLKIGLCCEGCKEKVEKALDETVQKLSDAGLVLAIDETN